MLNKDIAEILITEEALQARIAELGEAISSDYQGKNLLAVCILRGAVVFLADLTRQVTDLTRLTSWLSPAMGAVALNPVVWFAFSWTS